MLAKTALIANKRPGAALPGVRPGGHPRFPAATRPDAAARRPCPGTRSVLRPSLRPAGLFSPEPAHGAVVTVPGLLWQLRRIDPSADPLGHAQGSFAEVALLSKGNTGSAPKRHAQPPRPLG